MLFSEIQEFGYSGSLQLLRSHLIGLYTVPAAEPVVRFETLPGRQMQVDWCELRGGRQLLPAFVVTLGLSRVSFVKFVTSERFEVQWETVFWSGGIANHFSVVAQII